MAEQPEKQENLTTQKGNVEDLRQQYAALAEKLPESDRKACLDWLTGDPESRDPVKLGSNLNFLQESVEKTGNQIHRYGQELQERIKKGFVRGDTQQERLEWFQKRSFMERARILEDKDAALDDLFDPRREENIKQFKVLMDYFGNSIPVYRKFLGKEFKDRQKEVAELIEKKKLLEDSVLPTIVRQELKGKAFDFSAEKFKELMANTIKTHEAQKARFAKLPLTVQEEIRKSFKAKRLPERAKMLDDIEKQIRNYTEKYRGTIHGMLQPNQRGLTLFAPESAAKYLDWFGKLPLKEMERISQHDPDLENRKRQDCVESMEKILPQLKPEERSAVIHRFNHADLEEREREVAKYEAKNASLPQKDKAGWFARMIRKFTFSGNEKVKETVETFAIASEMTKRRERFQITHDVRDEGLDEKTAEKELGETQVRTAKVESAMQVERLRNARGKHRLKLDILEAHTDDRHRLKRALKADVDNPNAKLAGDILFQTKTGEVIHDAREYKRGELQREKEHVVSALTPEIEKSAQTENITLNEQDIAEMAKKTDWETISKEVLRKTA